MKRRVGRSLGSDGGPGGEAGGEAAFRDDLRGTVADWQRRLRESGPSPSLPSEGEDARAAIGREAARRAAVAESRGWTAIAANLHYVERLSRDSPHAVADAVATLGRGLDALKARDGARRGTDSAPAPPLLPVPGPVSPSNAPGSVAPPPMLDASIVATGTAFLRPPGPALPAEGAKAPPVPAAAPPVREQRVPENRAPLESPAARSLAELAPKPKLLVKNMLGFQAFGAFGRKASASDPPAQAPAGPGRLLGFDRGFGKFPPAGRAPPPPRRISSQSPADVAGAPAPTRSSRAPQGRPAARRSAPSVAGTGRGGEAPAWFYFLGGGVVLLAVAIVAVVIAAGSRRSEATARVVADAAPPAASGSAALVAEPDPIDQVAEIVHKHSRGGQETAEMRALIDAQRRLLSLCRDDATRCEKSRWTPNSQEALEPLEAGTFIPAIPTPAAGPLSAWLQRLKKPRDFPLADDPAVKEAFDYHTKNIRGREGLQIELFNCAAYADIFDSTIVKYGAPGWLSAVVYQESGCNPMATSAAGARGLWQFMPEGARAYGLRVVEDEIDERLNPVKSTEAAVHFLVDLEQKLGAWDLALAGYNMGPFGVVVRLAQAGENAGFWDLARAGLLPEETAGYVPAIEAYALILENLGRLQFSPGGKHPESTAELVVKPGTRLSLIARAASTSTQQIRELNPEFLQDVVPPGVSTARVPDAEAHRAKSALAALSPDDNRDRCVPDNFDWGARPFEESPYAKTCGTAHAP
jgi:Transglycosylase SLT domain